MKQSAKQWMKIFRFGISNEISVKNTEKHFADCTNAIPFFLVTKLAVSGAERTGGIGSGAEKYRNFFQTIQKTDKTGWYCISKGCFVMKHKYRQKVSSRRIKYQKQENVLRNIQNTDIIPVKQAVTPRHLVQTKRCRPMSNALLRLRESSHNFSSTEKESPGASWITPSLWWT